MMVEIVMRLVDDVVLEALDKIEDRVIDYMIRMNVERFDNLVRLCGRRTLSCSLLKSCLAHCVDQVLTTPNKSTQIVTKLNKTKLDINPVFF